VLDFSVKCPNVSVVADMEGFFLLENTFPPSPMSGGGWNKKTTKQTNPNE
jgi:hypothetical protein